MKIDSPHDVRVRFNVRGLRRGAVIGAIAAVALVAIPPITSGASTTPASTGSPECTATTCNVYSSVPWAAYKGAKVGILNLAPVPGATRWSSPLKSCLTSHGANVNYVDVGGDITKAPSTISGWLSSGVKAIFDVGIPLAGETALINEAKSKHIPIITWGAGNPKNVVSLDANQTVDGVLIAEYLVNKLGTNFSVAMISNSTNPALASRVAGVKAVLSDYPNVNLTYQEVPAFTVEGAQQATTALLQAHPDLGAVIGAYGDYGVGAANAVTAVSGHTVVVSMNGDPTEYAAIRSGGPLKATIADGHEAGGQLACETGAVMLKGGQPVGTHVYLSSVFVDSQNLPPAGQVNTSPRAVETLGS